MNRISQRMPNRNVQIKKFKTQPADYHIAKTELTCYESWSARGAVTS